MAWLQNTFRSTEVQDRVAVCRHSCLTLQLNHLPLDWMAGLRVYPGVKPNWEHALPFPPAAKKKKKNCISGYKVNLSKSLLSSLNKLARKLTYENLTFEIENDKCTYLGIEIAGSIKAIFQYNYMSILDRVKTDLDGWSKLPFSLAGWINVVKMTVMPRFLYLFQMIPIFLPKS